MKIVSVVGARPEFIQAGPLSRALRRAHQEVLVHTGQHYDDAMSTLFFEELDLPRPEHDLGVGAGSAAGQLAEMIVGIEGVLAAERPDAVLVRGDTNSTLAGALAASACELPLIHVEAGERSFETSMAEERNRRVVDHLAHLHLCASEKAVGQLAREGIVKDVHWVGDVMLDSVLEHLPRAARSGVLDRLGVRPRGYVLLTVHRAANTDNPERLLRILDAVEQASEPVVFPVHPRTRAALDRVRWQPGPRLRVIPPIGYLDMLCLESRARMIATDSGGVQREAYFLGVPCLTLRESTEWMETVSAGWNRLVGASTERIVEAWHSSAAPADRPPFFGAGAAAGAMADRLAKWWPETR